ncbi:hypothetical protein [Brucella intermedia]|uniref:hypothetical protein n=1 Tax=Brucella intermedia TaxID=94625 RepID=UPI0007C80242|nr:hypothetical protein [Brucella intermedia]OAE39680.1 hypothetical protein A7J42_14330 [Brucella intermedia]
MTSDLITRLSKLDAPDREVDAELEAVSLGGRVYLNDPESKEVIIERPIDGFWIRGIYPYRKIARYTASVDAVIALAERVLPGWTFEHIGQDYIRARGLDNDVMPMGWTVEISDGSQTAQGQAPTFPLAICIALLRAKEASNAE